MAKSYRKTNDKVDIAVIAERVVDIREDVKEIKSKLQADYVSRSEFTPVKNIVYGLVAIILTGFILALIALVIKK